MPLKLIRADITKLSCDAIVNAANSTLLGGGGVDGAIHKAAGRGLLLECMKLGGCKPGQAKITGGYNLPCKYVIHTVGPKWRGGTHGEKETLQSCYREALRLAEENGCGSVAFPLISAGVYGYPKAQAFRVAVDAITEYLLTGDLLVYLVIFDSAAYQISEKLYGEIAAYIDDCYVERHSDTPAQQYSRLYDGESFPLAPSAPDVPCAAANPADDTDMFCDAENLRRKAARRIGRGAAPARRELFGNAAAQNRRKRHIGRSLLQKGEYRPQAVFQNPQQPAV